MQFDFTVNTARDTADGDDVSVVDIDDDAFSIA